MGGLVAALLLSGGIFLFLSARSKNDSLENDSAGDFGLQRIY